MNAAIIQGGSLVILWAALAAYAYIVIKKIIGDAIIGDGCEYVPEIADVAADMHAVDSDMRDRLGAR